MKGNPRVRLLGLFVEQMCFEFNRHGFLSCVKKPEKPEICFRVSCYLSRIGPTQEPSCRAGEGRKTLCQFAAVGVSCGQVQHATSPGHLYSSTCCEHLASSKGSSIC